MALDAIGIGADFYNLVFGRIPCAQKFHILGKLNSFPVKLKDPEIISRPVKKAINSI